MDLYYREFSSINKKINVGIVQAILSIYTVTCEMRVSVRYIEIKKCNDYKYVNLNILSVVASKKLSKIGANGGAITICRRPLACT